MGHITIEDVNTYREHTVTTSSTGPFTVPFTIFEKADLRVMVGDSELAQGDFSFTQTGSETGGYQTGYITLGTAVANTTVLIWRDILPVRTTDLAAGPLSRDAINSALDRLHALLQDSQRDHDRSFRMELGNTTSDIAIGTAGQVLGLNGSLQPAYLSLAGLSVGAVHADWLTRLASDPTESLDDLEGVRFQPTYAAMTAMDSGELTDNCIILCYARAAEGDGGFGFWRWDSGSSATANDGTILAHDTITPGRFIRLWEANEFAYLEWWGGVSDGVTTNTTVYNTWLAAATAGTAPKNLRLLNGTYLFSTKPDKIEDVSGIGIEGSGNSVVTQGYSGSDKTEAVFHWYGASPYGSLRNVTMGVADNGSAGGSLWRLEAKTTTAPDFFNGKRLYLTSYASVSTQTITAISNASEGVFTCAGHGYSDGDRVVIVGLSGGTFSGLNDAQYTVTSATTDTFKLYIVATTTHVDTTSLGSYSASSGTVKEALTSDTMFSIDGTARATPLGVRGVTLEEIQVFGGREYGADILCAQFLSWVGGAASQAGWTARIRVSGSSGRASNYTFIAATAITGLVEDYSNNLRTIAFNEGDHTTTGNTNTSWSTPYPNVDVLAVDGTANATITNAAPRLRLVESDSSNVTGDVQLSGGSLLIGVDEADSVGGTALFLRDNAANIVQASDGGAFFYRTLYPAADGTLDIGSGGLQINNTYQVNAATVSSDMRLKDNVRDFTSQELAAARDMEREGICIYQLKAAIAEKGEDAARLHTGVIAQDIQAILERHGLDPWRYDFMCKDLVEWQDINIPLRMRIAEAENNLPEMDAEIAEAERRLAEALAEITDDHEGERTRAAHLEHGKRIAELRNKRDAEAEIASVAIDPPTPYFAPWEKLSIRYEPLILWLIKAQGQRLHLLEQHVTHPPTPDFDKLRDAKVRDVAKPSGGEDEIPEAFEDLAEPDEDASALKARLIARFTALAHRMADDSGTVGDPLSKNELKEIFDLYGRSAKANNWLGDLDMPSGG